MDIEEKALCVLEEQNMNCEGEIPIVSLCNKLGFTVANAGLDESEDGFIMVNENVDEILGIKTKRLIGVNATRDIEKKRFIIAHELGHYILKDKTESQNIYAHREKQHGRNSTENDIDYFAACLLMPKYSFTKRYKVLQAEGNGTGKIIEELQKTFNVPLESVLRRVDELQLAQTVSQS